MKIKDVKVLEKEATLNRKRLVESLHKKPGPGHYGGSLSCVDILTVLYNAIMNHDPQNPEWEDRDYFLLSKGHANAGFAAVLSGCGYFGEEVLDKISEHPKSETPGIEISSGSLGHGLSVGLGVASTLKLNKSDARVFVLLGDGELHEGQNWEAMQTAAAWGLDNLTVIVDRNKLSMDGPTETETIPLEPLEEKWKSFNWATKTIDGHCVKEILEALEEVPFQNGSPSVIIAKTVKGKGVSFIEDKPEWHRNEFTEEQYKQAIEEITADL